ncbi:helix-turn-helix domain-containing protein [Paraburkholderia sp.]|uniref:helix-turn-helix domain-containing protein n=1 Tax=Paraburkholderia sp. TaxID=1926495 RepID=UPI0023A260B8|nr:helix-turn-helix domain-containing protein [Paraburkholderia sp.]MDE1179899.1 DNA-binding protein [Paraburkholderia sp.]
MSLPTAEAVYGDFRKLPTEERIKFFSLLSEATVNNDNFTHEEVFGDLADAELTSAEAAEYLEVSMSTFRRYVGAGKLAASSEMGRNQLFASKALKAFKRALRDVKGDTKRDHKGG